jgi:hypothetical protein
MRVLSRRRVGHRGERNPGLCRVRRTVAHRQAISTSELGCGAGSIQVRSVVLLVARDANIRTAFEFSKRKFSQTYGTDLPVWALLASGSTGGVRQYLLMPLNVLPQSCCRSPIGFLHIL